MIPDPDLQRITRRVWDWARERDFRGPDPYDGLNSRLLAPLLSRSRFLRLAVIQGVKRSPVDLRPLLMVPPGLNPKGLALLLQGACEWPALGADPADLSRLGDALVSLASRPDGTPLGDDRSVRSGAAETWAAEYAGEAAGWGYDFPWQSKAFLQPAFHPTVVCTSFVLDALEQSESPAAAAALEAAARFTAEHLQRFVHVDGVCFSYSPDDDTRVYNASLFGARMLAQAVAAGIGPVDMWRDLAIKAVDFVVARQRDDGAWEYGEADHWHWIDNLHTGFNLETIDRTARLLGDDRWDESMDLGLRFYRDALFEDDGTPRYYTHDLYPLDPHSFAQGALTFVRLRRFRDDAVEFADRILARGVEELWDERQGGFRFQKHRGFSQPVIHLRWSQAWMFRALCARLALADGKDTP